MEDTEFKLENKILRYRRHEHLYWQSKKKKSEERVRGKA